MSSTRNQPDPPNVKPGKKPNRQSSGKAASLGMAWPVVVAAVCGILAVWVAAGSTGFLVTPLRHAVVGLLLIAAVVALRLSWRRWIVVLVVAAVGAAFSLLGDGLPTVDGLVTAAILASLVFGAGGRERQVLMIVAAAAGSLAVFRAACHTVPTAWSIDNAIGHALGWLGGLAGGDSPSVGGSLGGVDLLFLMAVFYIGWLRSTPPPRTGRAVAAAVAIFIVQAIYLVGLSHATQLAAALPEPPMPASLDPGDYRPTGWNVLAELRGWIPWAMPLAAAVLQTIIAAAMLRWSPLEAPPTESVEPRSGATGVSPAPASGELSSGSTEPHPSPTDENVAARRLARGLFAAAVAAAVLAGFMAAWPPGRGDLSGKTVVAYGGGNVDWTPPAHGVLEPDRARTYGLLPSLVANLGGQWIVSDALADEDLKRADVLMIIYPFKPWPKDQRRRIEDYVRAGGSLLVVTGPTIAQEIHSNPADEPGDAALLAGNIRPINELLDFAGLAFRDDTALPSTESWIGALSGSTHPAVLGTSLRTLGQTLQWGCTIDAGWPSRPILIGRWGLSEPGNTGLGGNALPDAAGQWGDVTLAAERLVGRGAVVAVADDWHLTNLGMADGYGFTGRLLAYLANRPSNPQSMWRQVLALLGYLGAFALIVWRPSPVRATAVCLTLAAVLVGATCQARANGPVPAAPTQNSPTVLGRPIAYVDASHFEVGSDRPWANDGMDGFLLTLARNGYLPLKLDRWNPEQLKNASLLVVMGPAQPFSPGEIRQIREFVEKGGHAILMVGATEAAAARGLLGEFEFELQPSPSPTGSNQAEAEPMGQFPEAFGQFNTIFGDDKTPGSVWFFQAWPIDCKDIHSWKLVWGFNQQPVVIHRVLDKGSVVLIGDSRFALNFNHGYFDNRIVASAPDNAHFWRWLLSWIKGRREWIPPDATRRASPETSRVGKEVPR